MITSEKMLPWLTGFLAGVFILAISGSMFFFFLFQDRIYPGIKINNIEVGGLTKDQAQQLLEHELKIPPEYSVLIRVDDIELASSSSQLKISREYSPAITQAYEVGRVGFPINKLWILTKASFSPLKFETHFVFDETEVEFFVEEIRKQVDLIGHNSKAILKYSGSPSSLVIDEGEPGRELLANETIKLIISDIGSEQIIDAKVASTSTILSQEQITAAQEKASHLINKRLILSAENVRLDLNDQELISLLAFPSGFNLDELNELLNSWQDIVSRPAQNAEFKFDEETLKVDSFIPHREGLEMDRERTTDLITSTIESFLEDNADEIKVGIHNQSNTELELPVSTTQPEIILESTNDLGISERIGFGDSEYDHSIKNRIHNVALTTTKINDTIIAPGAQFSFNKALGEVSSQTGFRSAYVIKQGRTELGDGGGVCQVSTTTFRAVLDAGLEVTRRLPHSYRVSYYELNSKPGIDATVYSGETDFRFVNDTDHHIIIHGETDSENLYMKMEIYGTGDGRTTEIKDHEVWGYVNPLPTEYYPDPSLPTGVKKQIDWAVAGVKAKFTHVIRDATGEITSEETYKSSYRPWSAKYLVGE
jgi:vancomycin resistance protein YoaR